MEYHPLDLLFLRTQAAHRNTMVIGELDLNFLHPLLKVEKGRTPTAHSFPKSLCSRRGGGHGLCFTL